MSDTHYTVAGYSRGPDGAVKFRVANDMSRAGVLARNGHSEVLLTLLPRPMTREGAKQHVDSAGTRKELGGLRACVERGQASSEKSRARARQVWNDAHRHLSHEDLVD
jgi:hypothetical protein